MKLENTARSRQAARPAIAVQSSAQASAGADHSHSHQSLPEGKANASGASTQSAGGREEKRTIPVSAELAAYVASKTT
jgi:hypothetical protein